MFLSIIVPIGDYLNNAFHIRNLIIKLYEEDVELILICDSLNQIEIDKIIELTTYNSNIKVIRTNYKSPGLARNAGLKIAQGKWIVFWDCDDNPIYCNTRKIIDIADNSNYDLAVGSFGISNQSLTYFNKCNDSSKWNIYNLALNPGIWRIAFRKSFITNIEFEEEMWGEDQFFLLKVMHLNPEIYFSPEIVYYYEQRHSGQLTKQGNHVNDLYRVFKKSCNFEFSRNSKFFLFYKLIISRQLFTILKYKQYLITNSFSIKSLDEKFKRAKVSLSFIACFFILILMQKIHFRFKRLFARRVKIVLLGGLGNQLFQIFAGLFLSSKYKSELIVEQSIGEPRNNNLNVPELRSFVLPTLIKFEKSKILNSLLSKVVGYNLHIFYNPNSFENNEFFRKIVLLISSLIFSLRYRVFTRLHVPKQLDDCDFSISRNHVLIGYFQSSQCLRDPFVKELAMQVSLSEKGNHSLTPLNPREKILVVHIRRGDYLNEPRFGTLSCTYYLDAVTSIMKLKRFTKIWVFSDSKLNIIDFIPTQYLNITIGADNFSNSASGSFEMMRHGSGYIIANSTFSWWAANLSYNPDSIVVAPKPWFKLIGSNSDIYSENWILKDAIFE